MPRFSRSGTCPRFLGVVPNEDVSPVFPGPPRIYLTGEAVSFNLIEPLQASVAQSVEQLIRNQQVGGSIPLAGSNKSPHIKRIIQLVTKDPGRIAL